MYYAVLYIEFASDACYKGHDKYSKEANVIGRNFRDTLYRYMSINVIMYL